MEILKIGHWVVKYDKKATHLVYSQIDIGAPEGCGCEYCLNFAAARADIYPKEVRVMFDQIGIDYSKEFEVFWCNKEANGLHCYAGELHFVGSLEYIEESNKPREDRANVLSFESEAQKFVWAFSSKIGQRHTAFGDKPLVLFFFAARVPWVLKSEEPQ